MIKQSLKIGILLLSALFISTTAFAQNMPDQCKNEGSAFVNNALVLNSDNNPISQRVFIIRNTKGYTVLVTHQKTSNPGASAGWASRIDGNKYSAIAVGTYNFELVCMAYDPPKFGMVNCQDVLSVCAFPPQKKSIGSFWIAENKTLNEVENAFKTRNVF